jgi:acetolactate synthase-1/3 small subunit
MRHTISVLVENKFGVLARISGLFSARGFNIDSLTVGETEDPTVSRMTIVVKGDDKTIEQVKKQLNKLIDVITVKDLTKKDYIDRELVLFKVGFADNEKAKLAQSIEKLGGQILHRGHKTFLVQMAGPQEKVLALLEAMAAHGIKELTRTGKVAVVKD